MDTRKWLALIQPIRERIKVIREDPIIVSAPPEDQARCQRFLDDFEAFIWEATAAIGDPQAIMESVDKFERLMCEAVALSEWYRHELGI